MSKRRNPFEAPEPVPGVAIPPSIYDSLRMAAPRKRDRRWEKQHQSHKAVYRGVDPKLALKVKAMREQSVRTDVDDAHRAASRVRLERLQQQRFDLGGCLDALMADAMAGRAYFKVYRQFKMYNDARFNPALVAEQQRTPA